MSVLAAATAMAQTPSSKEFNERYQLLVSKLGPSGVGIETLLDKWEAAYPDDADMLLGKFTYYFPSRSLPLWWPNRRTNSSAKSLC